MAKLPRWRRRQTLVNPEHQLKFTSVLLVQMTAVMLVIAGFAWFESGQMMALVLRHLGDFPGTAHELHLSNQAFLLKVGVAIGFTGLFQILFGIYASHKLAGPVHKMTGVLDRAANGDYGSRVSFRSDDQLEELSVALNRALQSLTVRQNRARAEIADVEQQLQLLAQAGPGSETDVALEALRVRLAALAGVEHHPLELVGS